MSAAEIPPPIDISQEAKKGVIDGVKKTLELFQNSGLVEKSVTYKRLIHEPRVLYEFIQKFKDNRSIAEKLVIDAKGQPIEQLNQELSCGVTLPQIELLLVKTCARYVLQNLTREKEQIVTKTRTVKKFFFLTRKEEYEEVVGGGYDERKVRELTKYIAFDWQLPLLSAYPLLNSAQLMELGDDLLYLRSIENIKAISEFDTPSLKKARAATGDDFGQLLRDRPGAIVGVMQWSRDMYTYYHQTLGARAWDFFARDKSFFMVCASLEKPMVKVFGDTLCYIAGENLEEMQRLNIDKMDVLLQGMKFAFGDRFIDVISNPGFAKDILRKLVESMLHVNQEKEQLLITAQLTCKAIQPQITQWLAKEGAA